MVAGWRRHLARRCAPDAVDRGRLPAARASWRRPQRWRRHLRPHAARRTAADARGGNLEPADRHAPRHAFFVLRVPRTIRARPACRLGARQRPGQPRAARATLGSAGPGEHPWTIGLEEIVQELDSDRLSAVGRRFRLAPFVQVEWRLVDSSVVLVAVPGVRLDADSQFGTEVSPKIAVRFDPVPQRVLRASYGSGFRAPSFQELLLRFEHPGVGYVVQGNPGLRAERSHGFEIGATWTPIPELELAANVFRNDVQGLIAVVTTEPSAGTTRFSYANSDAGLPEAGPFADGAIPVRVGRSATRSVPTASSRRASTPRRAPSGPASTSRRGSPSRPTTHLPRPTGTSGSNAFTS